MKMFHKGISEYLGLLETTEKEISIPIEFVVLMNKEDLLKLMKHQVQTENYEGAALIKSRLELLK
jgi:hypothetical protein